MRSTTHIPSDAQPSTTGAAPLAHAPPRTTRGAALTIVVALLLAAAAFSPIAAALAAQGLVIARFAGPPALGTARRWLRVRRPLAGLPGVHPAE